VVYIEPFLISSSRWCRRTWRGMQNSSRPRYAGTSRFAAAGSSGSGASASGTQAGGLGAGNGSQWATGLGGVRNRAGASAAAMPDNGNLAGSSHAAAGGGADTGNGPSSLEVLRQLRLQRLAASQAVGRAGSSPSRRAGR
jgi:hypothetical protein